MMLLRNYSFDFLREGHNKQPYIWRKRFDSNVGSSGFCIKIQALPRIEFFLLYSVDLQAPISL